MSTIIPINTLSGGVGRQAQSKRMPNEAENLDNVYCTLERSVERRLGVEMVKNTEGSITPIYEANDSLWYKWFTISENHRFLVTVDRAASGPDNILTIFRLQPSGVLEKVDDAKITVDQQCVDYLTFGDTYEEDGIKSVAIGTSLLLLNTEVMAGYTSDSTDEPRLKDFEGNDLDEYDNTGYEVDYLSAKQGDPEGEGVIWTKFSQFIYGDTVIDPTKLYNEAFSIWRADQTALTIGPENTAPHYKYRSDVYKGAVDVRDDPGASSFGSNGDTYFIERGGTAHADWGPMYLEDDDASSPTDIPVIETGAWIRKTGGNWRINKWVPDLDKDGNRRYTSYLSVKDYFYPDPEKPHLGQAMTDITKLKLPPPLDDIVAHNGAELMLKYLYPTTGDSEGRGKIYYFTTTYGTLTPGYYRVKDTVKQPYLHKIRTPDKFSIIDKRRMPMQLDYDNVADTWTLKTVGWDERKGGTNDSNPGPSPFKNPDGTPREVKLSAMSFYRDRLWLAAGDSIFSSRLGDFDNFWIDDPSNIVSTDPIDLSVSSNKYSPITTMIPFNDYLFINTEGDTQFELIGSENQVTPFTAEIAPSTFYSTVPSIEPQLMGNQIYFFDEKKLYIYFGQANTNINQAVDVSAHCPNYLPTTPSAITVSPAHNSIYFVDSEEKNILYTYTNRFAGDQVVQNAFFRQVFSSNISIESTIVFDNYLYLISTVDGEYVYLQRMPLDISEEDLTAPRLDNRYESGEATYWNDSNTTVYLLPFQCQSINKAIVSGGDLTGVVYDVTSQTDEYGTHASVLGNTVSQPLIFGTSYTTSIELSEQFVRDDQNNTVNGVLNLRNMAIRHANSGNYNISIARRGRTPTEFLFTPDYVGTVNDSTLPLTGWEEDGEFFVRVFGLSNELAIKIESDHPAPFNLTNIEFRGKFNAKDTVLERR